MVESGMSSYMNNMGAMWTINKEPNKVNNIGELGDHKPGA